MTSKGLGDGSFFLFEPLGLEIGGGDTSLNKMHKDGIIEITVREPAEPEKNY